MTEVSEHQKCRQGWANDSLFITSGGSCHDEEFLVVSVVPWSAFPTYLKPIAVSTESVLIQIRYSQVFDNLVVACFPTSIAEHRIHRFLVAPIVAFTIATIGARIWIGSDIYWTVMARRARDIHDDHSFTVAID